MVPVAVLAVAMKCMVEVLSDKSKGWKKWYAYNIIIIYIYIYIYI